MRCLSSVESIKFTVTYQGCCKQQVLRKRTHVLLWGNSCSAVGPLPSGGLSIKLPVRGTTSFLSRASGLRRWMNSAEMIGVLNRLERSLRGQCWGRKLTWGPGGRVGR